MHLAENPQRFGNHQNAFGFLRLLFASLVIVSHVPEIVDGNSNREILHRLTGSMTFGSFSVNGFFVISGFLITGSYLNSSTLSSYLRKRVARIYPAFALASVISLVIVAPLGGAKFPLDMRHIAAASARIATLQRPMLAGAFTEGHYGDWTVALNGAMWTIQYEFACYLLVILLGVTGMLRRPWLVVVFCLSLFLTSIAVSIHPVRWLSHDWAFPGPPSALPAMTGMFLAGASSYLFRHRIPTNVTGVVIAAVLFVAATPIISITNITYALFGGYLIFATARMGSSTFIGQINDKTDISYGVYLYAWPIEQLLIRYLGTDSLLLLGVVTWIGAAICGWISWTIIEKPLMQKRTHNGPLAPVSADTTA